MFIPVNVDLELSLETSFHTTKSLKYLLLERKCNGFEDVFVTPRPGIDEEIDRIGVQSHQVYQTSCCAILGINMFGGQKTQFSNGTHLGGNREGGQYACRVEIDSFQCLAQS